MQRSKPTLNRWLRLTDFVISTVVAASIAILLALALAAPAGATEFPTGLSDRTTVAQGSAGRLLLGGEWLFRRDRTDRGLRHSWARRSGQAGWRPIPAPPHTWNPSNLSRRSEVGTVGWYRKYFELPNARPGTLWAIRFEGVNYGATVFLNGRRIGRQSGMGIPFERMLRNLGPGVNRLDVRVDSRPRPSGLYGGARFFWNYGGILREVYVRPVYKVDMRDVLIEPHTACPGCPADVSFKARVFNVTHERQHALVRAEIAGMQVPVADIMLPAGRSSVVRGSTRIESPWLWSPLTPNLYQARVTLDVGGEPAGVHTAAIGIRTLATRRGIFYLNGSRARLYGISLHEIWPGTGGAITPEQRAADLSLLGELGVNVVRSQYPLHPAMLEEADRRGIFVWQGIPMLGLYGAQLRKPRLMRQALRYLEAAIGRDHNHPSLIAWNVGNELELNQRRPDVFLTRYLKRTTRLIHRLDPHRFTAADFAVRSRERFAAYTLLDMIGLNTYPGTKYGIVGAKKNKRRVSGLIRALHRNYPREALFITEFGAETRRLGHIRGSERTQARVIGWQFPLFAGSNVLNGAMIWVLRDFPVRTNWKDTRQPWNTKGLLAWDNRRKLAWGATADYMHRLTGKP